MVCTCVDLTHSIGQLPSLDLCISGIEITPRQVMYPIFFLYAVFVCPYEAASLCL